jgi:hypothetical protein
MVNNTSNTNITLATPEDDVIHLVDITSRTQLTFDFDPKLVEYELTEDGDLLLTFKNGGGYTFKGFSKIEGNVNVFVDGYVVTMSDLLLNIADASKSLTSGQQSFEEGGYFPDSTIQPVHIEETVNPENRSRVVTQAEATYFDCTKNVTYELLNHTNKFEIDSLTGEITVKEGAILDNEAGEATFSTLGAAYESNGIYTLTDATQSQDGAIWSDQALNLTKDFSITADLFLGSSNGADGITFVLHPNGVAPTDTLDSGSLNTNIDNAVTVEFDTYRNSDLSEPWQDHVSINTDGDLCHGSDHSQAIQTSNLEDGLWHEATFAWDATAEIFTVTFEGQTATLTGGLSQHIADSTKVHFGFTGITGGEYNLQQVNIKSVEGLDVTYNLDVQAISADTNPPTPAKVVTIPVTITSSRKHKR